MPGPFDLSTRARLHAQPPSPPRPHPHALHAAPHPNPPSLQDIVDRAYRRAKDLVQQNIEVLHKCSDLLMEREQIDGEDLQVGAGAQRGGRLLAGHRMGAGMAGWVPKCCSRAQALARAGYWKSARAGRELVGSPPAPFFWPGPGGGLTLPLLPRVRTPALQALLVEAQAEQYLKSDEPSVTIPYRPASA